MFATRLFTSDATPVDCGIVTASFSASTTVSSGSVLDLARFRQYVFLLTQSGVQAGNKTLLIYSCSTSASSISSASSNWTVVDSTVCSVTMLSASNSVSSNRYVGVLQLRAEKLFSGTSPIRYIRPVITTGSGVASNSVDSVNLICLGLLPQYTPGTLQTGTAAAVEGYATFTETDYV